MNEKDAYLLMTGDDPMCPRCDSSHITTWEVDLRTGGTGQRADCETCGFIVIVPSLDLRA